MFYSEIALCFNLLTFFSFILLIFTICIYFVSVTIYWTVQWLFIGHIIKINPFKYYHKYLRGFQMMYELTMLLLIDIKII